MSLYILFIPLFVFVLSKRVLRVVASRKAGNHERFRTEVLFLVLTIVIMVAIILAIGFYSMS